MRCKCISHLRTQPYRLRVVLLKHKIMATVNFYLDTRRMKENGKYPIRIRIQHRGKFLLSTEFDAYADVWEGNEYNRKEGNYKAKNLALRNLVNRIERRIYELDDSGSLLVMSDKTLKDDLKSILSGNQLSEARTFISVLDEFVATKSNTGTKTTYTTTRNKILAFDPKCTLDSIDRGWLVRFEKWMSDSGMMINAYAIHLRNIRAVFNYAIDEGYTELYPFRKYSIKKEETRKRSLSVEQLRKLRDYPCEEWQERYRNIFMLMFYLIGINAADLFNAKPESLVNGRLEYKRAKTGKLYSVKVEPEAMAIIEKYKGVNYLLDVMDTFADYKNFLHRMGIALKQIGGMERVGRGGKKVRTPLFPELSSYWSRHTWATIAAELDIPKETISEALGHSIGSEVTSIYIKFDRKKVDEANRKVIDYVNAQ